ncbi:ketoacyl-ACP synthase III [Nonomuraea rosea]|uniref:Ketoacyl-ACP synthase III n=1 Tax=Nonomuraea rosea TaxID=638574 RepID=A0ABP6YXU3_9ACTN
MNIGIVGTGAYAPSRVRTNEEVAADCGVSPDWIEQRTGVRTRHVADAAEATSDLGLRAAERALAAAGLPADQLGMIVVATSVPDDFGPSTACRVQAELGAARAVAFDLGAACTGQLFAMRVAHDWLAATRGGDGAALVIGAEVYSRIVNPADRGTSVLFGDGASACVLGEVRPGYGFSGFTWGSDGTQAKHIVKPGGGTRRPDGPNTIEMDGRAVATFITDVFPKLLKTADEFDLLICHQPNPVLLRRVAEEAGVRAEQLHIIGDRVGNLGAACIGYALADAADQGLLSDGDRVLIMGFGAGVTWGTAQLQWGGHR